MFSFFSFKNTQHLNCHLIYKFTEYLNKYIALLLKEIKLSRHFNCNLANFSTHTCSIVYVLAPHNIWHSTLHTRYCISHTTRMWHTTTGATTKLLCVPVDCLIPDYMVCAGSPFHTIIILNARWWWKAKWNSCVAPGPHLWWSISRFIHFSRRTAQN